MEEEEVDAMALWLQRWHQTIHCNTDTPNVVLVGQCQLLLGARQFVKAETSFYIHRHVRDGQHQ